MWYPNGLRNQSRSRRYWNLALLCLLALLITRAPTGVQAQSSDVVCGKFEQVAGSSDTITEGAGGGSTATFLFTVTTETGRTEVWEVHPLATAGYEHLIGQYVRIRQPDLSSGGGDDGKPLLLGFADYEIVSSCGPSAQPTATRARPTAAPKPKPPSTAPKPTLVVRTAQAGECGANNDLPPNCGCASYVALQQFGGKVSGNWPDANSLADQKYWNDGFVQYKCATTWRYRNDVPQAGDVMIVKGGSKYWLMPGGRAQTAVSAGHTGFVRSASYSSQKSFPNDASTYSGWQMMLRSANWGCYNKATFSDGKCQNVNEVPVFLPNGDNVSFWRSIKTPHFYTIVPAGQANKKALAPAVDPKMMPGVVQKTRNPKATEQIWVLETLAEKDPLSGTPYVRIINYKTGECLDVSGGSRDNGAAVIKWRCHDGDNQKWLRVALYDRNVLQSKLTGKVLDVPGGSQEDNVQIIQWERGGGSNQQWFIEEVRPPGCPTK